MDNGKAVAPQEAGHGEMRKEGQVATTSHNWGVAPDRSDSRRKGSDSMKLKGEMPEDVFAPATGPAHLQAAETAEAAQTAAETKSITDNSPLAPPTEIVDLVSNIFKPRADRRGAKVTVYNAQGIWPADALVFVANLPTRQNVAQLELGCHELFDIFGRNVVKVKVDRNRHPFALVQFETAQAAADALANNQGAVFDGRPLRLERGKAERAVVIARKDGHDMTEEEVRAVLEPYGPIEALYPTYSICGSMVNLPGMSVRFVYYQDCRDALHALSGVASIFRLQLATGREPDRRVVSSAVPGMPSTGTNTIKSSPVKQRNFKHGGPTYDIDRTSIYVGNLPHGTGQNELASLFSEYGQIINCNVVIKTYEGGRPNTFGFVQFANAAEAAAAVGANMHLNGHTLRVEAKEYTFRRSKRFRQEWNTSVMTPTRSPRPALLRIPPQAANISLDNWGVNMGAVNMSGVNMTPMPTPGSHLLPAHLFSPSPQAVMFPFGYYDATPMPAPAHAYNQYGMGW